MPREIILQIVSYVLRIIVLIIGVGTINLIKKYKWVEYCVRAAEQLANAGFINLDERKDYAKQKILEKYKLSEDELDVLIEACVEELNRLQKEANSTIHISNNIPVQ